MARAILSNWPENIRIIYVQNNFFIHSADMSYLNSQEMKEFTDIYGIDNKINKHLVQELIDISNLGKGDLEATNKEKKS